MAGHLLFQFGAMSLLSGVAIVALVVASLGSSQSDYADRTASNLSPTPLVGRGDVVLTLARLDEASLACRGGRFHVTVALDRELPPESQLLTPVSGPGARSSESVFCDQAGESVRATLISDGAQGEASLPSGVSLVGYDKLSVVIVGVSEEGYPQTTNAVLIDAPSIRCS